MPLWQIAEATMRKHNCSKGVEAFESSATERIQAVAVAWLSLSVLLLLAAPMSGQLYTGSVSGTVVDPSGALIPSARITLLDEEKGYEFTTTTDASGRYLFRQVPPGKYAVSAQLAKFQTQRKEGIVLAVNQNVEVNFSLKIGAESQVVDVTASGVELQTQDAVTGQVVDRVLINDLPLIQRDLSALTFLAPGVTVVDTQCPPPNCYLKNNFISNGSRNATADFLLDGVSTTNFEQNSGILMPQYTPSIDAVEEFSVEQSNFSAEHGFSASTIVNMVTRSGTNDFHGSLYGFFRNARFDANQWFNDFNGTPKPAFRNDDFGATVGGPIRKNKTFFFGDYEGVRQRSAAQGTGSVPTASMRMGDFGELCGLNGGTFTSAGQCSVLAGQLWDPYSFSGNTDPNTGSIVRDTFIPFNNLAAYASPGNPALSGTPYQVRNPGASGNLIDPVAAKLIQLFPNPTQALSAPGAVNWFASGVTPSDNDQFDAKIDNRFSDKSLFSVKYSQQWNRGNSFDCYKDFADPCTSGPVRTTAHLVAINETYTISPKLLLTFSYGFTRQASRQLGPKGNYPNLDPVTLLGMPAYMDVSGYLQIPTVSITGYPAPGSNNTIIGNSSFSFLKEGSDTHQLIGTLSWARGAHELKFGAEGRMHRINFGNPGWPGGSFVFDFSGSSQNMNLDPTTGGDGMASFLMGIGPMETPGPVCSNNCVYEVPNFVSTQSFQFAGFVQDNYRIRPKLTLNLGFRYELNLPRTERFNRMDWLDPNLSYSLPPGPGAPAGTPALPVRGGEVFASRHDRYNYDIDYRNFEPRFGFAYELPRGTVVRGGYGIYFSQPRSGAAGTGPWGYQGYDEQTPWLPSFQNLAQLPGARFSDPFPGTGPKLPPGNSLGTLNDVGFAAVGPIKHISLRIPYEQTWSFGLEKSLPGKIVAEANYIGKKGTRLYLGGFRESNHLGAFVDSLTPAQIGALVSTQVPNPFQNYITDPLSSLSGATVPEDQLLLPFPQFTNFDGDSPPIANSIYHAAQFRMEKGFSSGLEFLVTYTISKSIDNASATDDSISFLGGGFATGNNSGGTIMVQDPNNLRPERAVSTYDIPQIFQVSYVYALPFGRGKKFASNMDPVLEAILGGWQTNGILSFDNGRPITPYLGSGIAIPTYGQRPNLIATLKRDPNPRDWVSADPTVGYFSNPGALTYPGDYQIGNSPRTITSVRQPGTRNTTLSVFKEFPLSRVREGMRIEYRLEAFNALNHPQFAGPDAGVFSGSYGKITSTANNAREVQMGLKIYW
jgi:Carboxypeptidase regulatory-like domain